jgi:hypothetical protein
MLARRRREPSVPGRYTTDARVAPLQVQTDAGVRRYTHAHQFCESEVDKRLPTEEEALLLAPFVAQGSIVCVSKSGPIPHLPTP